jgi:hypothetical protein
MGDKAYSSAANRSYLRKRGIKAVIPVKEDQKNHRRNRGSQGGRPPAFDREQYKERNTVEFVQGLGHRERGVLQPGAGVGGVAGADLGFDQGAQQLFRCPALGLRGEQELGGEPAYRGQFQPAQPFGEVGCQRRRGRGHDSPPMA